MAGPKIYGNDEERILRRIGAAVVVRTAVCKDNGPSFRQLLADWTIRHSESKGLPNVGEGEVALGVIDSKDQDLRHVDIPREFKAQ